MAKPNSLMPYRNDLPIINTSPPKGGKKKSQAHQSVTLNESLQSPANRH